MTSRLSKIETELSEDGEVIGPWATEAYVMFPRGTKEDPSYGYEIVNRGTGQVELRIDQEPQGLIAMLWLQEQYDDIMKDPDREYNSRKPRSGGIATAQPRIMN